MQESQTDNAGQATAAGTREPEPQKTERDLQRQALRELVELSTQCAAEESQIEQRHTTELAQEEKDFERSLWAAEQRAKGQEDGIKSKHAERIQRYTNQFETDTSAIRAADQKAKHQVQAEYGPQENQVRKKLDEALWLADAELEARTTQIRVEQKRAKDDLREREDEINNLEGKAQDLLKTYGHKPSDTDPSALAELGAEPAAKVAPPPITPAEALAEGEGAPATDQAGAETSDPALAVESPAPKESGPEFPAKRDRLVSELNQLEHLSLPKLFVGSRPYIALFILLAIAAGATQFLSDNPTDIRPQPLIVVGGATLVCAIAIGFAIRVWAKSSVRRLWTRAKHDLGHCRKAAKDDYENALEALERRAEAAKAKRKRDTDMAKARYGPMLNKLAEKKKSAVAALEADRAAKVREHEDTRDRHLMENDGWLDKSQADVRQRLAKEQETIKARHAAKLQEIEERYVSGRANLEQKWKEGLARIARPMQRSAAGGNGNASAAHDQTIEEWNSINWKSWNPPRDFASVVRFGRLEVDLKQITDQFPKKLALPKAFSVPANLAFPRQSSLLIHTDREGRPEAIATLQMVMARLLTSLPPGRVKFTIIDPVGLGQNFAGFMHLADHDESLVGSRIWTEREHIEQRLLNLTEHMETVIQKYLRNEYETIDQYNAQAGELAEPYRFLVIADFPVGFEGDSFRRLSSIASTGARCGVYTLVIRDTRVPLPSGAHFDELEQHSVNLVRQDHRFVWKDEVFKRFPLQLDRPPDEGLMTDIMDVVGRHAKDANRVEVPFEQIAPRSDQEFWSQKADRDMHVPIGRMGATRQQSLRLGRGVAQHALVAGKTGSGKSTLLHAIITNMAMWYRPDEVELYLIDFKKGVEFKTYATHELPHARAIAVESDREFGLSVLQRLDGELTRRGEIFRRLGVQDLASYREIRSERREDRLPPIPRTLLIIDEFQEFFSEDDKLAQDASVLIDRLVRQGRAFGIHVFLGSQTIGGTSGLSRSTIGQMAVRIALQTSEADSQLILGDGNSAARLLSRPGEAIYNDAGGLVEGNSPFQVAWLPDEKRDEFLERVLEKTRRENAWFGDRAVVFEGNAPADVRKNAKLTMLLGAPRPADGAPPPVAPVAYLGEPVAIKEPTGITLRRQSGANVLIVGQHDESAVALMESMIVSLAAQHARTSAKFVLLDGTPADSHLASVLPKLAGVIPQEMKVVEYRGVEEAMGEIGEELKERIEHEDAAAPEIYLCIFGLQRYRPLRKSEDSSFGGFGSADEGEKKPAPDKVFADLLRDGPHAGMHAIAWIDTPVSIERTLDRGSMREFDNRVLFQMSANDSSNLIDSPAANKLGMFRALAYSEEQGTVEKFRPYALMPPAFLDEVRTKLRG
jgi:hypothetical protein